MFITCLIDQNVFGRNSTDKQLVLDIDPHDEIENLIVLVTLKLTEIDPVGLEIYYQDKKLQNNIKILKLNLQPEDYVVVRRKSSGPCPCILI